jgi:hypothetical protein
VGAVFDLDQRNWIRNKRPPGARSLPQRPGSLDHLHRQRPGSSARISNSAQDAGLAQQPPGVGQTLLRVQDGQPVIRQASRRLHSGEHADPASALARFALASISSTLSSVLMPITWCGQRVRTAKTSRLLLLAKRPRSGCQPAGVSSSQFSEYLAVSASAGPRCHITTGDASIVAEHTVKPLEDVLRGMPGTPRS